MIVKMKLGEIRFLVNGLRKLIDKELPVKTAYKISKITQAVNIEFNALEVARGNLVKKYGKEEEVSKGKVPRGEVKVDPEKEQEFFQEFNTLLDEDMKMDIDPISIDDLENISLTPADLLALQRILKEEEKKEVQEKKQVKKKKE